MSKKNNPDRRRSTSKATISRECLCVCNIYMLRINALMGSSWFLAWGLSQMTPTLC